jgi:hypothetical protein
MDEADWLESVESEAMLAQIFKTASEQQVRLFACACCRRIWHLLLDERSRQAIVATEAFARGEIGIEELGTAGLAAKAAWVERSAMNDDHPAAAAYYCTTPGRTFLPAAVNRVLSSVAAKNEEMAAQAQLLREMLSNPFQQNT